MIKKLQVSNEIQLVHIEEINKNDFLITLKANMENIKHASKTLSQLTTIKDVDNFFEYCKEKTKKSEAFFISILYKKEFKGMISAFNFSKDKRKSEIGYWLCKSVHGRGITTRSLRALIHYYFYESNLCLITLKIHNTNHKSINIATRLNFNLVACYTDTVIFQLKKGEISRTILTMHSGINYLIIRKNNNPHFGQFFIFRGVKYLRVIFPAACYGEYLLK